MTRCVEAVAETPGKSGKNFGQKITGAFPPNSTEHRSRVKERNLGNEHLKLFSSKPSQILELICIQRREKID